MSVADTHGPSPELEAREGAGFLRTWSGYLGGGLLLFALLRFSVTNAWDVWCTLAAVPGLGFLVAWGWSHAAELRRRFRLRGVRYGSQAVVSGLLLLGALGLVNFVAYRHAASFDLTESHLYTLSPETRQVLAGLDRDIHLLAFFSEGRRGSANQILRRYADGSPRLTFEFVDPYADPDRAQQYDVTQDGTVVFQVRPRPGAPVGGKSKPLRVEAEGSGEQGGGRLSLSEEKLTNTLLKVTRGGTKTVYFLEGDGEAAIDNPQPVGYSRARQALEGQAFTVKRLNLGVAGKVPADCALLVIAGPAQEPPAGAQKALEQYLEAGGKALIMVDPAPGAGMAKFLDHWGLQVRRDLIVDATGGGRAYGFGPAAPLVTVFDGRHPITRNFHLNAVFPIACSLEPKAAAGDAQVSPLAQTSDGSFSEPYDGGKSRFRFDPARDRKGPLLIAAAVTRSAHSAASKDAREARLVVVGDSDFAGNHSFNTLGNGDFFMACVNWLAEEEDLIAIRPRSQRDHRAQLTEADARGLFWLVVVGMPLAALAAGVAVQVRRR